MTTTRDQNKVIFKIKEQFDTKIAKKGSQNINNYYVLGLKTLYLKSKQLSMIMAKLFNEKLLTLCINLDKSRKVLRNPYGLIKEREIYPSEK